MVAWVTLLIMQLDEVAEFKNIFSWPHNTIVI